MRSKTLSKLIPFPTAANGQYGDVMSIQRKIADPSESSTPPANLRS